MCTIALLSDSGKGLHDVQRRLVKAVQSCCSRNGSEWEARKGWSEHVPLAFSKPIESLPDMLELLLPFETGTWQIVKMVKNCDQMTMMDYKWICKVTWTPRRHPMNIFKCTKSASWNVYCVEPLCLTCCFGDTFIYSIYHYHIFLPPTSPCHT